MVRIKQVPDDFVVSEITSLMPAEGGAYVYFWMKKRNYTTLRAIERVAQALRIPFKRMGFAGNKDSFAVTEQLCSAFHVRKEQVEGVHIKDIELRFFGYGEKPISLGDLAGNRFELVVRDCSEGDIACFLKNVACDEIENKEKYSKENKKIVKIINYFDEQRFSTANLEIGRAIIHGDFKKAVELIVNGSGDYNKNVLEYTAQNKNDYIGALRLVPRKILLMLVHSYQSFLFNEIVAQYVRAHCTKISLVDYSCGVFLFPDGNSFEQFEQKMMPLVGFGTEILDIDIKKVVRELLKKEKITLRDFIIRKIPELSIEGSERALVADANNFFYVTGDDELNQNKKKITVSFTLPKGSYATIVVKKVFGD